MLRLGILCLALTPLAVASETHDVPSTATKAVIYQGGGIVTHEVTLDLSEGTHQLVFTDLPPNLRLDQLLIDADGLQLGALRFRDDLTPARQIEDSPEISTAKAAIETIEAQIQDLKDRLRLYDLTVETAQARIKFLSELSGNEGLPQDAAALAEISDLLASQTLAAKTRALEATISARTESHALTDLNDALNAAKANLSALVPEPTDRPLLVIDATTQQAGPATLSVSFLSPRMSWTPAYDFHLSDSNTLQIDRRALVSQNTGENWRDIALTLSTQNIVNGTSPSNLTPWLRRIDGIEPRARVSTLSSDAYRSAELEMPAIAKEKAFVRAPQGLALTYRFAQTVSLASDADQVQLPFDTLTFETETFARAVPLYDETAFVMATFTNTAPEPIFLGEYDRKFYDGGFVGAHDTSTIIAPGGTVEMGFGPILGLQIKRTVLDKAEGDVGFISKSNAQSENARIDVTNLTDQSWALQLQDRVPYSEQEDLSISYSANPRPDISAVDDQRGVLQWDLDLTPGETTQISTRVEITWPEGMILR